MHRFHVLATVGCISVAMAVTGCASSSNGGSSSAGPDSPAGPARVAVEELADGATAVRLQATVYELRVPAESIGSLDAAKLAAADFAALPPQLGEARALYVIDQQVSLASDQVQVGSNAPMVTNTRVMGNGKRLSQVEYREVGAIIDFKGEPVGPRQLQVTSTVEVAAVTETPVEIAEGAPANAIRSAKMSLKGLVELGKPAVLISGDASSRDKDGRAVVYVARLVLGAGQAAAK